MGLVKGNVNFIQSRNGGIPQAQSWVRIVCEYLTATANHCSQFRKIGGSAVYRVPVGKTFKCKSAYLSSGGTSAIAQFSVGYADNAPPAFPGGVFTPTNPVYFGTGDTTKYGIQGFNTVAAGINQTIVDMRGFDIPAQKYPFVIVTTTGGGTISADILGDEV